MKDQIVLKGLKSECTIGINDHERKIKQRIIINITIFHDFSNLNDDIKKQLITLRFINSQRNSFLEQIII